MRLIRTVAVVAGLALVLSACGLLNGLVPDQTLSNPLGINGKQVTVAAVSTPGLQPQAAGATTFSGSLPANTTFDDVSISGVPAGIQPNGFTAPIDLDASATVSLSSSATSSLPATFNLTSASLSVTIKDGSGAPTFTKTVNAGPGTLLTFTKTSCPSASTCDYSIAPGPDLGTALLTLNLSGSDVATLWQIATAGSSPNTVEGTVSVTVDQPLPSDASITVTLSSKTGTLTF